jgi:hypothetical protein
MMTSKWPVGDKVIVTFFAVALFIAMFVDYINAFAPVGGVTVKQSLTWSWPPTFVWPWYFWWCEKADPVLCANPLWIKWLSVLSPVFFTPFYSIAIPAILAKKDWIRIPCVIYASILFVDLTAFFAEGLYGEAPSPNMWLFTAGYGPYLVMPLFILARFWHDDPFGNQANKVKLH